MTGNIQVALSLGQYGAADELACGRAGCIIASHSSPRTTEHYDRARGDLDRRGVHFLTAYVAGV